MALFTIRVELHNASWDQYTELYKHLSALGITDTIVGDDGVRYRMSPAEYNFEGNATCVQVRDAVDAAAAKVVRSYAVFVTEAVRRTWVGLKKV